jgi:sugar transferase (PEP-CTERM/EpsH1 system associated)
LRILHLVLSLKIGGLEKFVIDLSENYPPGVFPEIVCLEEIGELGKFCEKFNCISLNKKDGIDLIIIQKICKIVRDKKIQLIHTHNQGPNFYGSISGFLCGVPVVHTKHGQNNFENKKRVILDKISSFFTNKIICVSKDAENLCVDVVKIPKKKLKVILNGIDTDKFRPRKDRKLLFNENDIIIGNVARLAEEKDHHTLLKATKILREWNYNIKVVIIGDGILREKLEGIARDYELNNDVVFLGMRNDIDQIVPEFDIFVLSSTSEGTPLTLLEAMSCGLPVIATDVGGNPEVVNDGETGFIIPPSDPTAIALKLKLLINDPGLRQKMGKDGRIRAIEKFSIKKTAREYFDLYCDILNNFSKK